MKMIKTLSDLIPSEMKLLELIRLTDNIIDQYIKASVIQNNKYQPSFGHVIINCTPNKTIYMEYVLRPLVKVGSEMMVEFLTRTVCVYPSDEIPDFVLDKINEEKDFVLKNDLGKSEYSYKGEL